MSNVPSNPEQESERDSEMSTHWREHSSEMPPPALDAAILAAAHRAVDSKPTNSASPSVTNKAREAGAPTRAATGPQRWWMPLAAAATIGAIAIGVLQTAPQEQRDMAPSVSDARPAPAPSLIPPRDMYSLEPPVPTPSPAIAAAGKVPEMQRKDAPFRERGAAAPAAPPMPRAEADAAPPPMQAGKLAASASNVAPEPFPADRKKEAADSLTTRNDARQHGNAALDQPSRSVLAQAAPAASAPQAAAGVTMLAKSRASAESASMSVVDVDATILRIRKLYEDDKLAEAARQLIALRTSVPDADLRLPPEMRAWAATVKP